MIQPHRAFPLVLLAATVTATLAACSKQSAKQDAGAFHPLVVGQAAPAYVAKSLTGQSVSVGGVEPPTVLNVWATWCQACSEEMGALDSLHREFASRGVRVIGVSVDDGGDSRVQRFVTSNHIGFTIAHDPTATIEQSYALVGVPTTFVISHDGKILWSHTGDIREVMDDARNAITAAIPRS